MAEVYQYNNFGITLDERDPVDERIETWGPNLPDALEEGRRLANEVGVDPDRIHTCYQLQVVAYSKWIRIDDGVDHQEIANQILEDLREYILAMTIITPFHQGAIIAP